MCFDNTRARDVICLFLIVNKEEETRDVICLFLIVNKEGGNFIGIEQWSVQGPKCLVPTTEIFFLFVYKQRTSAIRGNTSKEQQLITWW